MKIESKENAKFKYWRKLIDIKSAKKEDEFLVFGKNFCREMLTKHPQYLRAKLYLKTDFIAGKNHFALSEKLFSELDLFQTKSPIYVFQKKQMQKWDPNLERNFILLPLGDPANLGACLRSAKAFGIKDIVLLKEACDPYHPKAVRAASSVTLDFEYYLGPSIHELVPSKRLWALDQGGSPIEDWKPTTSAQILVGEEGEGIPQRDFQRISIPMDAEIESLNAGVAVGIALYEWQKKRGASSSEV